MSRADADELNDTMVRGLARADAAMIASVYAPDARLLPPGMEAQTGQAVQQYWQAPVDAGLRCARTETVWYEERGDLAVEEGRWELRASAGAPVADAGKFLIVHRRQPDGSWRYAIDMFNSSLPPRAEAESPVSDGLPGAGEQRRTQLRSAVTAYFDGLRQKDFELIPYADDVVLRAPLAPGGVEVPLVGRDRLREIWWAPLPGLLGEVTEPKVYVDGDLTAAVGEAQVEVRTAPPVRLRVADRFTVDQDGRITEQVNYFDPRDLTSPGWQDAADPAG